MAALANGFGDRAKFPAWDDMADSANTWCFLAEIVEFERFIRYRLIVRDLHGDEKVVAFYLDHDEEFDFRTIRVGHTIVIMYAQQHAFLDGSLGVRVEEPEFVKVFPISLLDLQYLGRSIPKYCSLQHGMRVCHGCDKSFEKEDLNRCGRCLQFYYCSKECQQAGWLKKTHKATCKTMADAAFQALINFDFDNSDRLFIFSDYRGVD
ncbi:hypothetical protein P8C59_005842 [Phyllachora maydis]|uniref:MYND-type domain-containing protein n=1 Tax=Phyllachora maydis TaxID=1825666 RepID=A0AAD9MBX2_9PEZI|nr:hypothetical protein P8C59_005842 [Phyllachora maydis]